MTTLFFANTISSSLNQLEFYFECSNLFLMEYFCIFKTKCNLLFTEVLMQLLNPMKSTRSGTAFLLDYVSKIRCCKLDNLLAVWCGVGSESWWEIDRLLVV